MQKRYRTEINCIGRVTLFVFVIVLFKRYLKIYHVEITTRRKYLQKCN
jgi:hypothetical protein